MSRCKVCGQLSKCHCLIYMVKSKKYGDIKGIWTNPDELVDWVLTQEYSWAKAAGETDLDVFMERNQLSTFKNGVEHSKKFIPWSDLFPTK